MEGKITQDEALTNADSASNMLWLINQATAGELSLNGAPTPPAKPAEDKKDTLSAFNDFKINVNA
jgi:twitching motility protein PilU